MMTLEGFQSFAKKLEDRGLPQGKAGLYASLIGDDLETDENGKWVVRNEQREIIDRIDPVE